MEKEIKILINSFNKSAFTLLNFINDVSINSSLSKFIKPMEFLVQKESNKIIDIFIIEVLKYESYITSDNDDINNEFYCGNLEINSSRIGKIFNFKSIWSILNDQNKNTIKSYMKLLCRIARSYFNIIYVK